MLKLTFAGSVGTSKNGTLLYCTERGKELSDIFFGLLLTQHTHKQFSFYKEKLSDDDVDEKLIKYAGFSKICVHMKCGKGIICIFVYQ